MQEYKIQVPGGSETTVLLSDEEAEKRGLEPVTKKAKKPANKQAKPENKAVEVPDKRAEAASRAFGGGGSKSDAGPDAG